MIIASLLVALSSLGLVMGQLGEYVDNYPIEMDGNPTGYGSNFAIQGYNTYDPNRLLNGFFPVWSMILLGLAGVFLSISIVSFSCYTLCGCRKDAGDFKKLKEKPSASQILA